MSYEAVLAFGRAEGMVTDEGCVLDVRAAAARFIRPGGSHHVLSCWPDGRTKPRKEHLMAEIVRRDATQQSKYWDRQKCADWLHANAHGAPAAPSAGVPEPTCKH